jgi:hypothetical protein
MDNDIQCYYNDDWIMIENEYTFFYNTDTDFINLKFYPIKIKKDKLYKLIYYDNDIGKIHSKKQSYNDIPRYSGYIRKNDILYNFKNGCFTYETLMSTLKEYYTKNEIINIYNFIPQQIFFIIMKEIQDLWSKDCVICNTKHILNIESDYVERILIGDLFKEGILIKRFISKLKSYYQDNFIILIIKYL